MLTMRQYKTDLTKMLENLPEEKIIELVEKAQRLAKEYDKKYGRGKEVIKIDLIIHSKKI